MASTKITVRDNGPLRVEGDFEILDMQGKAFGLAGRTRVSLCRCGHSANKPFCDGTQQDAAVPGPAAGPRSAAANAEALVLPESSFTVDLSAADCKS